MALLESRYPDAVTYATTASTPRNLQMHPGMWPRACCSSRSRRSRLDSANRPFPISAVPDAQWFDGPAGSGMADPCRAGRAVERWRPASGTYTFLLPPMPSPTLCVGSDRRPRATLGRARRHPLRCVGRRPDSASECGAVLSRPPPMATQPLAPAVRDDAQLLLLDVPVIASLAFVDTRR